MVYGNNGCNRLANKAQMAIRCGIALDVLIQGIKRESRDSFFQGIYVETEHGK